MCRMYINLRCPVKKKKKSKPNGIERMCYADILTHKGCAQAHQDLRLICVNDIVYTLIYICDGICAPLGLKIDMSDTHFWGWG